MLLVMLVNAMCAVKLGYGYREGCGNVEVFRWSFGTQLVIGV